MDFILDLLKATPRPTESTISSATSRIWQDASLSRKSLFPKLVLRVVASARNSLKSFSTGARLAPSMLRICKALQSGGTDEQPPKVRRRLTRVTSTASAISVASSVFDVDDNTPSTAAHKTIYPLCSCIVQHQSSLDLYGVTFGTFGCNTRFAAVPTTHEIPNGVFWQTSISTGTLTRRLWRWCAFNTITSSSEQRWRKGALILVSRFFWTRQSRAASVEPSCNPAFWPQLGASFALRCQSCFAYELVCCHELQKLSILFSVLPLAAFFKDFWALW